MAKKTKKQAFTIVELVIVIAVIAILAAILIPTYSNLVKKANEATALVDAKNLITEMLADILSGDKDAADLIVFSKKGDSIFVYGYDASAGRVLTYHGHPIEAEGDFAAQVGNGTETSGTETTLLGKMLGADEIKPSNPQPTSTDDWRHPEVLNKGVNGGKSTVEELGFDKNTMAVFANYDIDPDKFAKKESGGETCDHVWDAGTVTKEATCTEAGVKTFTCTKCNETKTEAITALGHDMQNVEAKEATCTEAGHGEGQKCSRCDYVTGTTVIPAKGHTEVTDPAVAATCTATGKTEGKHCSVCNAVLVAQTTIPTSSHTYDENVWDKNDSQHWHVCSVCNGKVEQGAHSGNPCTKCGYLKQNTVSFATGYDLMKDISEKIIKSNAAVVKKIIFGYTNNYSAQIAGLTGDKVLDASDVEIAKVYWNSSDGTLYILSVNDINVPKDLSDMISYHEYFKRLAHAYVYTGVKEIYLENFVVNTGAGSYKFSMMFSGLSSLERIYVSDDTDWTSAATTGSSVVSDCPKLLGQNGKPVATEASSSASFYKIYSGFKKGKEINDKYKINLLYGYEDVYGVLTVINPQFKKDKVVFDVARTSDGTWYTGKINVRTTNGAELPSNYTYEFSVGFKLGIMCQQAEHGNIHKTVKGPFDVTYTQSTNNGEFYYVNSFKGPTNPTTPFAEQHDCELDSEDCGKINMFIGRGNNDAYCIYVKQETPKIDHKSLCSDCTFEGSNGLDYSIQKSGEVITYKLVIKDSNGSTILEQTYEQDRGRDVAFTSYIPS